MKQRYSHKLALLAIVLLLCLSSLPGLPAKAATKVRYGVSPFQDTLLPILGREKGWYTEEGLDVEFVVLGWTEVQEALAAGQIDVAINNVNSVVATHERFADFVYYYGFNIFDAGAALMARPQYKSAEEFEKSGMTHKDAVKAALLQMKGKTVVTTGNTDMEQSVLGAAFRAGLEYQTDMKIVDLNPDEGLAAFLSGTGDFYLGGIPQRTRATKEGMKAIVVGADLTPPPINGIVTTKKYYEANQETLLKLLHVWFRIVNYVDKSIDDGAKIILDILNKQTGANMVVDDFKTFWQKYEHYPLTPEQIEKDILSPDGYAYWKAHWDDCNRYFAEIRKSIKAPVDPKGIFLMEDVQKAYVEKYGKN